MIGLIIIVELYAAQYGEEQHNQIQVHKMQRLRVTIKYVMLIRIIMTMMLFSWPGAAAYSRSMARWRFCKSKASNGAGLRLIVMIIIINFLIMIIMFNIPILIIMIMSKFASLKPPMALIFIENFWSWPGHVQLSHCDHDVQLSHPDYHIQLCKSKASNGADLRLIILNFLVLIAIINFLIMIIMFNTSC